MKALNSIDIFCSIVDNFGDIGVCWRLARQMTVEHQFCVRLFIDNIQDAKAILPDDRMGVQVIHWTDEIKYNEAADIVIEAFGCSLSENVLLAIVLKQSVWIDLEYLTAEDWAIECHAIPSKHPTLKIEKTLFFPSFDRGNGGIIRENDLVSRRNTFLNDKNAQNEWRKSHFMPEICDNTIDISLFYYKYAPIEDLMKILSNSGKKVRVFKPVSILTDNQPNFVKTEGLLEIYEVSFLPQYDYDYLLWTCDLNFVRGEDSFVRAQLAGKPFIWNIYVQDKSTYLVKLKAFLEKIRPFYDEASFERLANLHELWNEEGEIKNKLSKVGWIQNPDSFAKLESGAKKWSDYLLSQTDLATQLLAFAEKQNTK